MLWWNVFLRQSVPANTCKHRLAHTLVGDRRSCELKQEWAQEVIDPLRGIVTPTHTNTDSRGPLLSLFLFPAECLLRLFCKFMLTFESTPPAPVHRSSKGCMNYHIPLYNMIFSQVSLIRIHHTFLISSSLQFLLCWYIVCTVWWKKSSITVELKANRTFQTRGYAFSRYTNERERRQVGADV